MSPLPRRQNPQRQPLTVSLRKICKDYPAGAGVLKELLQNADDAGASTVKFVLDTSTYADSPVLVEGLSQYQGQALLAYNDAVFSDQDFQSLASLGDSKKIQEKATTGKFGLGFSSVYNWTDCPSILSGSTLLFLDPHHSWSRIFDPPGGPDYDFPASFRDEAMANQLRCFSLLNSEWERPFDGTIIRVPLRKASQAAQSEISSKEASIHDIRHSMDSFASEVGLNGLLFLRSVRRIILSVDDQVLDEVEILNRDDLIGSKKRLNDALTGVMTQEDLKGGEIYHEVRIRHLAAGKETLKTFAILNLVAGSVQEQSLRSWAASEKLFPWVAVAALITDQDRNKESGRLYSVLPLPIMTGLPVHIHGLFSISTDRCRLHGHDVNGAQDDRPEIWNKYLFGQMIPSAWAKLLLNICQHHQARDLFHLWPGTTSEVHQWWYGMGHAVIDIISQNEYPVWFTEYGYISIKEGLLAPAAINEQQRKAFREAEVRVIYLPNHLLEVASMTPGSRSLSPETLYECLVSTHNTKRLSRESKLVVLEYLKQSISIKKLASLEIFPFEDGYFRSLTSPPIFVHRDSLDNVLFTRESDCCIDTNLQAPSISTWFHDQAKDGSILRYRDPLDLCNYFLKHLANATDDTIVLGKPEVSIINKVWEWILEHCPKDFPLLSLKTLWLVPLDHSKFRRLVPLHISNSATWFEPGNGRALAMKIAAIDPSNAPKLIADNVLTHTALQHLLSIAEKEPSLRIRDGKKIENFVNFLGEGRALLQSATQDMNDSIFQTVKDLYLAQNGTDLLDINILKSLPIFKEVQWPINAQDAPSVVRLSTDLTKDANFVGLRKLIPLPSSSSQVYLEATDDWTRSLYEGLNLVRCLDEITILKELVVPALQSGSYEKMAPKFRVDVAESLLQNYFRLPPAVQGCFTSLPIVPLVKEKDNQPLSFACPEDLVDPHDSSLMSLYFEDEMSRPEISFYQQYSGVLASCGMMKRLSERLVLERVKTYEKRRLPFDVIASRARALLQLPLHGNLHPEFVQSIRSCVWLPGSGAENSDSLVNALNCRDSSDRPLVGHVWHTVPFRVKYSWRLALGWNDSIDVDILITQLAKSIEASDIRSAEQTLNYLSRRHSAKDYTDHLRELKFIRSSNGLFISPSQACRTGAEKLIPYIYNVESRFWDEHHQILTIANVPEMPDLGRLRNVLQALGSKGPLGETDLDVAVEVASIWSCRFSKSLETLKVPDQKGLLVNVSNLVFNDAAWLSEVECTLAHPKLSRAVADRMEIQPLSDLWRNGDLGISDMDEDEFHQVEEVADGIRDTLDRYTQESTFHEYLANADDCGSASAVNFLFDGTTYNTQHLLTPDLNCLQGPALLVHNDGVFTDSDFEGLKRVGRGSKRDDPTTIGKFGRGSQTMFHWTDAPMILSGQYLLILDPLRQYLPFNYRTKQKKPGVKVKYSKLRTTCQDQLAPFEGLWGFTSDSDSYGGTIFRFPLRSAGIRSDLLESLRCPDPVSTVGMFQKCLDEARLTLLFLRKIECIDFCIRHNATLEWKVSRGKWPETGTFSDWAHVIVENRSAHNDGVITRTIERWWRVIEDVNDAPADLQNRHKRRMKYVECGIAAYVPVDGEAPVSSLNKLKSKFLNCVPLKFESTLPVQVHATFLLSGDRQNIATEETSQDAGSDWNNWLLTKAIPLLYIQFLEDLGRKIGNLSYNYFPVDNKVKQQSLSDLIRTAFWQEIQSSSHRLFSVVEAVHDDMKVKQAARPNNRQAPRMVEPNQAVFDILDKRKSDLLRPLLSNCSKNLVRPPAAFNKHVRSVPGYNFVTPSLVRGVLRLETAVWYIQNMLQANDDSLSVLLSFIKPADAKDLDELDGCAILPLLNGGIEKLSLSGVGTQTTTSQTFFCASAKCQKLFSFAPSYFVQTRINEDFFGIIIDSKRFNIERFEKSQVHVLLKCKQTWAVDQASKTWLFDFWRYMNSTPPTSEEAIQLNALDLKPLQQFPLLLLHQGSKETLNSLEYVQENAAVLDADIQEHKDIYADFQGLEIVDSKTIPQSLFNAEKSLSHLQALNRLLKSLEILAEKDAQGLTEFVASRLKASNIKTLQTVIRSCTFKDSVSVSSAVDDLPVWQRISSKEGFLAAKEALAAEDPAFVVPWMKDYHQFTKNDFHRFAQIDSVSLLKAYILPDLPQRIDEGIKDSYIRLVNALSYKSSLKHKKSKKKRAFIIPLGTYRLAARQDGELCLASALYDDSDDVFAASFRFQHSDKFLLAEVRHLSSFWHEIGLRRCVQGQYNGDDYLLCLQLLQRRLTSPTSADPHLVDDTKLILGPLCAYNNSLNNLDTTAWVAIAKLNVFPVATVSGNEPQYRRKQAGVLVLQKNTLTLENMVLREHAAICWSQTSFAIHEPSSLVISKVGSKGEPNCAIVWQHLKFLAVTARWIAAEDIKSFVSDLQKTYHFLQCNPTESRQAFSDKTAAIWWNPEVTDPSQMGLDALCSSWTSLENIILDSPCNAPPLVTVNSFLAPYASLLKEIGCKSLYYPPVAVESSAHVASASAAIRQLREKDILNDVRFEAEGETVSAHKVVLASRSLYCQKQFHGPWASESGSNTKNKAIKLEDMSYATLKILVDYCYDEYLDWAAGFQMNEKDDLSVIADKLDALLDVLIAADRWMMPTLHNDAQLHIFGGIKYSVRPDNVQHVLKVAEEANAELLRSYCHEYSIRNAEAVLLANAEDE